MIRIRPAAERGHTRLSWLDSRHTFCYLADLVSFGPAPEHDCV